MISSLKNIIICRVYIGLENSHTARNNKSVLLVIIDGFSERILKFFSMLVIAAFKYGYEFISAIRWLNVPLYWLIGPHLNFNVAFRTMCSIIIPVLRQTVAVDDV